MNTKKRSVVAYSALSEHLRKKVLTTYPNGFMNDLIKIPKSDGTSFSAFTLETEDTVYLVKLDEAYLRSPEDFLLEVEDYEPGEEELN